MARARNILAATALAAFGGAATYYWREQQTPQPRYSLLRQDKVFELRDYPPLLTAEVEGVGDRKRALGSGFRRLADYIFAKDRPGEEIAMTTPVLQARAGDGPGWATRFIMPQGSKAGDLPAPPAGVLLDEVPARRVAAVRFSGSAGDEAVTDAETRLRHWCEEQGLQPIGDFEYAYYNSPMIPPFLRRNEVLVPVSRGA